MVPCEDTDQKSRSTHLQLQHRHLSRLSRHKITPNYLHRKENGLALFTRGDRSRSNDEAVEFLPDAVILTDTRDDDYFPPTRYTGIFAAFHYSDFRLLWVGQLGWSGANWMEQIARNWLIWELTGSGVALGLVNLFRALP